MDTTGDDVCNSTWQAVGAATTLTLNGLSTSTYYWQVRATGSTQADPIIWRAPGRHLPNHCATDGKTVWCGVREEFEAGRHRIRFHPVPGLAIWVDGNLLVSSVAMARHGISSVDLDLSEGNHAIQWQYDARSLPSTVAPGPSWQRHGPIGGAGDEPLDEDAENTPSGPSALDSPTVLTEGSGEVAEYYHVDALGSVRLVTDQTGAVLRYHDYLPFGEEWQGQTPAVDKRLFTGQERDVESGLDYFGARHYRSDLGRFTTVDPVQTWEENLVGPQRWNRYAYAGNDPGRFVDPDGRDIRLAETVSKEAARFIRDALVEYVRRPEGRTEFEKLAADKAHVIILTGGSLNDQAALQMAILTRQPIAVKFGVTQPAGDTATVTIDVSVHTDVWATPAGVDTTGVVTVGHEFEHADAWASADLQRYSQGDVPSSATGPAMQKGKAIYAEKPTLSKKEAEEIVNKVLGPARK